MLTDYPAEPIVATVVIKVGDSVSCSPHGPQQFDRAFEFGMKNGNLLDRGSVVAPDRPGLGI